MTGNNGNGDKEGRITLHYLMLSRANYVAWAIKMRVFMQAQGVWDAVEPRTPNTLVEVKKDKMALAAIYQGIPEDLLFVLGLKAEFESLNMKESEGVDEFTVKVINIVSTMRALGDTVDESYVVKKLLRAVPDKFLQIASALEQFGDQKKDGTSGANSSRDKSDVQSYNCQDFGHYAAECKNPRRERNQENNFDQNDDEPVKDVVFRYRGQQPYDW